ALMYEDLASGSRARRTLTGAAHVLFALQLDGPLVAGLGLIAAFGLVVLYSASGQSVATVVRTALRLLLGTVALVLLARVNPNFLRRAAPWLYVAGCVLILIVAAIGHVGMGAQRWLNLGLFRFQPSELMKLAVPMTCAWYLHDRPLPPSWRSLGMLTVLILMPVGLVAIQPDLGTAALIAVAGMLVIVLAGLRVRAMVALVVLGTLALTFFVYVIINAGMVTGLLPVVGVPLPLVSYGGSSVVTLLAGFGILMALYSRRKLIGS